jgi:Holliday junction DNA helicase RuvB
MTGQAGVVEILRILIEAAKGRGEALDHVLLTDRRSAKRPSRTSSPTRWRKHPHHRRAFDRARRRSGRDPDAHAQGRHLFIDVIHRLGRAVEEVLYRQWKISRSTS